ncbi:MAG: CopG family antitoxin [Thermodesulfobacteriota bacterium]
MKEKNRKTTISNADSLEDIGKFWDHHSLADYWDQTEATTFDIGATRRRRITLEPELYEKIKYASQRKGIFPETLIHLWLSEKLNAPENALGKSDT